MADEPKIYSMTGGPTYTGATRQDLFDSAMNQPLSLLSTMEESVRHGVLNSYGLGTAIKNLTTPQGNEAPSLAEPAFGMAAIPIPGAYSLLKSGVQALTDQGQPLTEDAYKSSASYRKDIPWDQGMTDTRAAALAASEDAKKVREYYATKRPIWSFVGKLAGGAMDPVNYIPVFGEVVQAAAIARFGTVAGRMLVAGADAAANTGIAGLATSGERGKFGDDVSWAALTSQMADAALIGSAFGALHGIFGAHVDPALRAEAESRLATLRTTQEGRIALNEGIDALAHGEDINLSPNSTQPIARVAGDVAKVSELSAEPAAPVVTKAAGINDVAEAVRAVREQHPELDPVTSPSKFDALLIADLQAKGFDGVESKAPADAVPLNFDPSKVDVPEMVTGPNGTPIEASLNPTSPAYGKRLIAEAEARLPALQKQLAKANRPHNVLRAKLAQNSFLDGVVDPLGTIERRHNVPDLIRYYEAQKARGEAIVAGKVDTTRARPDPLPDGLKEAQARVGRPDDAASLDQQFGVNHKTGSYNEESEILHLAGTGRLTEEDLANLRVAHDDFEQASAFGEAMKSLATCLI